MEQLDELILNAIEDTIHATINSFVRRQLSYRNQSDLRSKSMDWFLYDNGLRHVNKDLTSVTLKQLKERLPVLIGK